MPTCAFVTLGCKINQYETQAVREEILALGYEEVPPRDAADVYVVNACSVTQEAGSNSRRAVLRLARRNPAARIVVMGCSTPADRDQLREVPQVAVLVGNEEKGMVATFLVEGVRPGEFAGTARNRPLPRIRRRGDPWKGRDPMDLRITSFEGRVRAYLKVQDGCSSFCSYCIIPYLRGLSRSRPRREVLSEARRLAAADFREIVLTGIHLQDYGGDLDPPSSLLDLLSDLADLAREAGLWRIRLSSIGERSFTPEMIDLLSEDVFCPHWHIPLQSGDDRVLGLMRRDYRRGDFMDTVALLGERFDRPAITTDVIVGHPGETADAFENTLDLCRRSGFAKIHIFPFSAREGTRSARLADQVPPAEIGRRARRLAELESELGAAYRRQFIGEEVEVLVEGARDGERDFAAGMTERSLRVKFRSFDPLSLRNTRQRVQVDDIGPGLAIGRLLEDPEGVEVGGGLSRV